MWSKFTLKIEYNPEERKVMSDMKKTRRYEIMQDLQLDVSLEKIKDIEKPIKLSISVKWGHSADSFPNIRLKKIYIGENKDSPSFIINKGGAESVTIKLPNFEEVERILKDLIKDIRDTVKEWRQIKLPELPMIE